MSTWKDLPTEILNLIFGVIADDLSYDSYLINYSLTQCQVTCKNWSEQAQRHLYKSIIVGEPREFMQLITTLSSSKSNPGRHVKSVYMDPLEEVVPHVGFLRLLLLKCPNIEKLDTLRVVEGDVYEEIRIACERGACTRLKYTPVFEQTSKRAANKQYNDTLYFLRNNLQDIVLDDGFVEESGMITNWLLQSLKDFLDLRSLTVRMKCGETAYQIGEYIQSCPHVVSLSLAWYAWTNTSDDILLDVHSVIPCPNIKRLALHRIPVTRKLLEYIMHAFPNINSFGMTSVSVIEDSNDIATRISSYLWVNFLVYIHRTGFEIRAQFLYISDIPAVLADFFATINFKAKLIIEYRVKNIIRPYVDVKSYSTTYQERKREVIPDLGFYFVTAVFQVEQGAAELPHVDLLLRTGSLLKSLEFNNGFPGCNGFFLNHVFQQCPSLIVLTLSNLFIANSFPEPQSNTSIKCLKLVKCGLSQEVFPMLSLRLPSLSKIWLKDHISVDSTGHSHEEYIGYIIKMPNTSFDALIWESRSTTYDKVNLKIVTPTRLCYYFGNEDCSITQSCIISFKKSWNNRGVFSMYIQCQDIKSFEIKICSRLWTINFTEKQ